jgi:hypothetical protein
MTATSVVCPDCGSPVSVVGAVRPQPWAATPPSLPDIDEDGPIASARPIEPAPLPAPTEPQAVEPAPAAKRGPRRLTRSKAPAAPPAPAKARYVAAPPDPTPPIDQTALFGPVPNVAPPILHDWSAASPPTNGAASVEAAPAAPRPPAVPREPATPREASATLSPADPLAPAVTAAAFASTATASRPVAGSYLAPSATYASPISSRTAPTPAAWSGATRALPPDPTAGGNGSSSAASRGPVAAPAPEREAVGSRHLTDWLTIGGSVLVIVSFFLPWATDGVIGSLGSGFTANWGLANPGHLVLIGAAAVVLILHAFSNTIPTWFRSGVLPLLVGGILAGLAFAYYARPAGGGAGVAVMLAGALVLIGGGMLACRPERHATGASRV